jgi:hypothetical protein
LSTKLKVKVSPATKASLATPLRGRTGFAGATVLGELGPAKKHFTESLILAQDERWRRA